MALIRNIDIDQGSTFSTSVSLTGNDNAAFDLTGYTASAQMRKAYGSNTVSATFTCTIPSPTNGQVILRLTDEETSFLKAGRYVYDVVVESIAGDRYRAIEGLATVNASVTR